MAEKDENAQPDASSPDQPEQAKPIEDNDTDAASEEETTVAAADAASESVDDSAETEADAVADDEAEAEEVAPSPAKTVAPPQALPRRVGPPWLDPPWKLGNIDGVWLVVILAMSGSAVIYFGWRALGQLLMGASVGIAVFYLLGLLIQLIYRRYTHDSFFYILSQSLLLGLIQPVYAKAVSVIIPAIVFGFAAHMMGRTRKFRVPPAVFAVVIVWFIPFFASRVNIEKLQYETPTVVNSLLKPNRIVTGDALQTDDLITRAPWWEMAVENPLTDADALLRTPPMEVMIRERQSMLSSNNLIEHMLTSGELPRMESVIVGAVPGMIGCTNLLLLILFGLYLMHRRLAFWPMTVCVVFGAVVALHLLPVETIAGTRPTYKVLAEMQPMVAITYIAYQLLCSPMLLLAMLLSPMISPMSPIGRWISGLALGALMIVLLHTLEGTEAGLLAVVLVALFTRPLDALQGKGIRP